MSAQVVRVDSRTVWRPINQEADLRNHHHTCSAESEHNWAFLTDRAIHSLSRCCGEGGILRELAGCQTACVFSPARISFYSVLLTVPTIQTRLTVILENALNSAAPLWHTKSNQHTKQTFFIIRLNETTDCSHLLTLICFVHGWSEAVLQSLGLD